MQRSSSPEPPEVRVDPGWRPVAPPGLESGSRSFVSGADAVGRLRVAYFRDGEDRLVGRAWFGPGAEGPPDHAHGGSVAAVLDEAMGAAAWMAGYPVVAARLTTDFRLMLPLGTDCLLQAWVEGVDGRKVRCRGRLLGEGGELFAEAEGLFIQLDEERFSTLLARVAEKRRLPLQELQRQPGSD